ncbi:outer membrane protein assembly factor BamE [Utexia brackfieldae]|uniref:outer membrane protein assembly factor BamE n=1 Tax=Utexia brackfieldae TaxID=3074108 RepID=UPI00370DD5C6
MRFIKYVLTAVLATALLSGCSLFNRVVYRPDINQGNYITQSEVDKLQVGQTKAQVVYVMGSPMLQSVFGDNIWYYVFREQPTHGKVSQVTYTLTFDNQERLTEIKTSGDPIKAMPNETE